jgi:gluconate 2-dehydrogenase gamma chain
MRENDTVRREIPARIFFSEAQFAVIEALAARIIPGTPEDPGAREADAAVYVDRALGGKYADLQTLYRTGLDSLDRYCRERHGGAFAELDSDAQDAVLDEINDVDAVAPTVASDGPRAATPLDYFFNVVREHLIQGTFCDPVYGGNRDGAGWKLVGFPGAYWSYAEWQGQRDLDTTTLSVQTLQDLPAQEQAWLAERGEVSR